MGGLLSGDKRKPIKSFFPRIANIIVQNFRGIFGVILSLASCQYKGGKFAVMDMWFIMFWCFLLQPVAVPVTAFIPIFLMPMTGIAPTNDIVKCYFNDNIALFIISSMLLLLLNNSGFDRRFALKIICSGDACQYSGKRMIFKCGLAAFFLSMFSNRLIVTSTIIQYVTPVYQNLKSSVGKSATEPNFDEMRYIVNNAIQTSASIGSTAILHSAYATIAFRAVWAESPLTTGHEYPDIFNYLQYSFFAFPVACLMFVLNFAYHMLLLNYVLQKPMTAYTMNSVKSQMLKHQENIPKKLTSHEKVTVFFSLLMLLILFLRWNKFSNMGWADFNKVETAPQAPVVKDVTVLAIFALGMHILPRSLNFMQFFLKEKKSELKDVKPESSILFWRFVDRNTNYGYFFLIGSGLALELAIRKSGLGADLAEHFGKNITNLDWMAGLFVVCLISSIFCNAMTGVAGLVVFLPFVLNMCRDPAKVPWVTKAYLPALAVGVSSSFGFMWPFMYTPAYFCHYTGKVPKLKMAKYSILSVIICCVILWLALCYWAPYLWDPLDLGFKSAPAPTVGVPPSEPEEAGEEAEEERLRVI